MHEIPREKVEYLHLRNCLLFLFSQAISSSAGSGMLFWTKLSVIFFFSLSYFSCFLFSPKFFS